MTFKQVVRLISVGLILVIVTSMIVIVLPDEYILQSRNKVDIDKIDIDSFKLDFNMDNAIENLKSALEDVDARIRRDQAKRKALKKLIRLEEGEAAPQQKALEPEKKEKRPAAKEPEPKKEPPKEPFEIPFEGYRFIHFVTKNGYLFSIKIRFQTVANCFM